MFVVNLKKKISKNTYKTRKLCLGLSRSSDYILSVLTIQALYELIAYNSNPKPSLNHFTALYHLFVKDPKNKQGILDDRYISFGKGGHKRISLNGVGLLSFVKKNQHCFQICPKTLACFISSIFLELQKINNGYFSQTYLYEDYLYRNLFVFSDESLDDLQTRIDKNHAEIDEVLKNFCITGLIANNKK